MEPFHFHQEQGGDLGIMLNIQRQIKSSLRAPILAKKLIHSFVMGRAVCSYVLHQKDSKGRSPRKRGSR